MISSVTDRERGLRIVRYQGVITDDELIGFYRQLYTDPDFDPAVVELSDARDIDRTEVTRQALLDIIELVERQGVDLRRARRALVATRDAAYGLGRMYQSYREGAEHFGVFRSIEEAESFLGLAADTG